MLLLVLLISNNNDMYNIIINIIVVVFVMACFQSNCCYFYYCYFIIYGIVVIIITVAIIVVCNKYYYLVSLAVLHLRLLNINYPCIHSLFTCRFTAFTLCQKTSSLLPQHTTSTSINSICNWHRNLCLHASSNIYGLQYTL